VVFKGFFLAKNASSAVWAVSSFLIVCMGHRVH
jgi:hypothetical protein